MDQTLIFGDNFFEVYEDVIISPNYKTSAEEYHVCRYCGNKDSSNFKSKAHLLPHFLGNTQLFADNECDQCNNIFGKYETSLSAFGGFRNTVLPVRGKKGFPKFKNRDNIGSLQYTDNDSLLISAVNRQNSFFEVDDQHIKFKTKSQSFIPLHVYKALTKFAISIMNRSELVKFHSTIKWLLNPNLIIDKEAPLMMIYNDQVSPPIIEPRCGLFRRKKVYNSPEYCFVLLHGYYSYQIFLNFNSEDKNLDFMKLNLPLCFELLQPKADLRGLHFRKMNTTNKTYYKENIKFSFETENL